MNYRKFGKTGKEVSILGLGCMRFPEIEKNGEKLIDEEKAIEMIRYSIDNGINYIDTAYPYHNGQSEPLLGKALKNGYREKTYIATKNPVWKVEKYEDFEKYLNEQLEFLQTNYIDFYLLHALNKNSWNKCKELRVFDFIKKVKNDGKIKHIGFSFHDGIDIFKEIIDSYDWEFTQIQFNYLDTEFQAGLEGLKYAYKKNIPVVIMEPLRGGMIVNNLSEDVQKAFEKSEIKRKPVEWALNYIWDHCEVSTILSGMSNMEQLKENILLANKAEINMFTKTDHEVIQKIKSIYEEKLKVPCTSCGYCLPCPKEIPINNIFSFYNEIFLFNSDQYPKRFYQYLIKNNKDVSKCIKCGQCEEACPQGIEVIKKLIEAEKVMSE